MKCHCGCSSFLVFRSRSKSVAVYVCSSNHWSTLPLESSSGLPLSSDAASRSRSVPSIPLRSPRDEGGSPQSIHSRPNG